MSAEHLSTPPTKKTSGIYTITCQTTGKVYVGSAVRIKNRWWGHTTNLRANRHYNGYLQNAWNKYGEANFTFTVIELVSPEQLIAREQYWIDHHESYLRSKGFNLNRMATSPLGMRHSRATKSKISAKNKGKKRTPEFCARQSVLFKGRKHTPEARVRMSESRKGRKATPEHCAHISAALRGNPKVSESRKGRKATPEHCAHISAAIKGRIRSPEQCARNSAAQKAWRAKAKARRENQGPYRQGYLF